MPLFGKKDKGKSDEALLRHGRARLARPTFRKFVNAGKFYGVDVLVLGGDIAGKMVVPILDLGGGKYRATIQSITHELDGADERRRVREAGRQARLVHGRRDRRRVRRPGGRPSRGGQPSTIGSPPSACARWIEFAEERLAGTGIRCYITGGNDDAPDILEPLDRSTTAPA